MMEGFGGNFEESRISPFCSNVTDGVNLSNAARGERAEHTGSLCSGISGMLGTGERSRIYFNCYLNSTAVFCNCCLSFPQQ